MPILVNPVHKLNTFIILLSVYIILLGLSYIQDFFVNIISVKVKNKIKRGIRITLPKIFESIIPYSVMCEINSYLEMESEYRYVDRKDEEANMYIIVHTSNRGVNKMGHLDIYFDHKVMSYGNYDEGSRKFSVFGDGVLFQCDSLYKYINFCIDYSKKTIFLFGLRLNEGQREKVMESINQILDNVYDWDYRSSKIKDVRNSYAARLARRTKANFYKFKKGKYKTYYVLGTNCCYLVDDIVGKSGIDILSLNGIVTPGTYYDYLNRELHKKNGIVVSKQIYNDGRRPMKKIKK